MFTRLSLLLHYWNRKRMFDRKYRDAVPYVSKDSNFEQEKYQRQLDMIGDRRWGRVLEIGCGEGVFLERLAPRCDRALGVDLSDTAIERAREWCRRHPHVSFEAGNIATMALNGPYDLVVATDVLYYLGQEHDWGHVVAVLKTIVRALAPGGRLLLTNCHTGDTHDKDWLSRNVMRRYREACEAEGLILREEKEFRGWNGSTDVPYLISLLEKSASGVVH